MTPRPSIDVSHLPHSAMDHRSPIWWGNLLLLMIETTMFGILIAAYFYIRLIDFQQWPPPLVDVHPPMYHPVPELKIATINLALLLLSVVPTLVVDRACLKRQLGITRIGLVVCILFGLVCIALRFPEFKALHFRWDSNAYGSVTWTILGMHLLHLITGTCETGLMTAWIFKHGMDDKHARDIRVGCGYWYWIVGIWVLLYALVFWGPRVF
jgi:cytochrome c oxidase subunit III